MEQPTINSLAAATYLGMEMAEIKRHNPTGKNTPINSNPIPLYFRPSTETDVRNILYSNSYMITKKHKILNQS